MFEVVGSSVQFDYLDGLTVLGVRRFGLNRRQRVVKRAFDLVGSLALLILLAPLLALVALADPPRLTRPRPVPPGPRRARGRAMFEILKFRSMVPDAEERKAELREPQRGARGCSRSPPTRASRASAASCGARRSTSCRSCSTSSRGEMSLVGPRPAVVEEDRQIQGFDRRRLHLTPGMTGPWQILGSARIPLQEMVGDRLPLRRQLVAVGRRQDPAADRAHVVLRRGQ